MGVADDGVATQGIDHGNLELGVKVAHVHGELGGAAQMPQTLVGLVGLDAIEGQEGHGRDALLLEVLDALLGDGGVVHHDGVGISAQDGDDGEVVLALGHLEQVSHPAVDARE